jgi:hypothetical protein
MANILSITDSTKKEEKRKKSAEPGEQFFCEKKKKQEKKLECLARNFCSCTQMPVNFVDRTHIKYKLLRIAS